MPSSDAKWIIGAVVGAALALSAQINLQIGALRAEVGELRTDVRRMDDRLRAVEIEMAKVVQRLDTLERIVLPNPESD